MKKTPGKKRVQSESMCTKSDQDSITISSDEETEEVEDKTADLSRAAKTIPHKSKIHHVGYKAFCRNENLMSTYLQAYGNDVPVMWITDFLIHDHFWRSVDLMEDSNCSLRTRKYISGLILGLDETFTTKVSYSHFTLLFICFYNKHKS